MTFLVHPPRAIEVETDGEDRPARIRGEFLSGPVQPVLRWIAEVDWWSRPVAREYWRVLLRNRLMCEIYRDLAEGTWYVERVYD
jgi:hypothetical protein